jgi:hypothetical protein
VVNKCFCQLLLLICNRWNYYKHTVRYTVLYFKTKNELLISNLRTTVREPLNFESFIIV